MSTVSTMSTVCIEILFIRDLDADNDDRVVINKDFTTNEFTVTYTDDNDGKPVKHRMTGLYRQKALDYVYYMMKNQYLDEEKFDTIQVTLPAMPRMIVSGDKFNDVYYRDHFYELIGFGLDSLETAEALTKPMYNSTATNTREEYTTPSSVRQHLFFD